MCHTNFFRRILLLGSFFLAACTLGFSQALNPSHAVGTVTGKYHFNTSQVPDPLVELSVPFIPNTGVSYQWEKSSSPTIEFTVISGATQSSYTIPNVLLSTTYYRRKSSTSLANFVYSNVIKISVVSATWEDVNYVREHTVLVPGMNNWTLIDPLPIGEKLQSTTYMDGLGRSIQQVSRETATPNNPNSLWGDMVQFAEYDAYGRQQKNHLPYTTTSQSGKLKTNPGTEQAQYYSNLYTETSAFSSITFDNSPLNRVLNIKQSGTAWAAASGSSAIYDLNTTADNVQQFDVDYIQGNAPVHKGLYPVNSLYKSVGVDENGKKVVEYINKSGQTILKKVQLDDNPSASYSGWICTYNVYDDFGQLRFQIQPEGVKYLDNNSWSFAGTNGQTILAEQCFQYEYDDRGRTTWKKAPGAQPLKMIYDKRDRVVFMQDGNQAALSTPQWTANIYDEIDRPLISALYNTTKSINDLKTDISNAATSATITVTNSGTHSVSATTHLNPISSTSLNNSSVTTVLKYLFYDDYSFTAVKTFNTNYTNLDAYAGGGLSNIDPIGWSKRILSAATGSMTRVLGTTTFLSATQYYTEKGQPVQSLSDNIKAGTDITTVQYHYDGRVMSSCSDHTVPNSGYTNYKILNKYLHDKLGRVTSVQKKFGSNNFKTIAAYSYDDVGRLKAKTLDPGYAVTGTERLESLYYSYNIHGQITGINKDYALKNYTSYNKWEHFFGMYLGFDNRDNVFSNANLNGQVTGILWNTQGDDAQRKYDFTYDNAGRLVNSAFKEKQHTGDSWSSTKMDFSVSGTSDKITYDLNGNLLNMLHKGVVPGTASPITIDNLSYTYSSYSNKLQSVTDQMTTTTVNGLFGDFKDGANGSNPDYVYDNNGNLVIDLNKNAKDLGGVTGNGIKYNFLDKPEEIRIAGKGTIKVVYSADGEKLQRLFIPEPSGATTTTSYINQYVYQESSAGGGLKLQFINFEEGRIRVITPTSQDNGLDLLNIAGNITLPTHPSGGGGAGVYDYFIMDYQQNVRMILTEETHHAANTATMETSRETLEESIFGQTGSANEVDVTRYATPSTWQNSATGSYVSQLGTNAGHNTGPNTLQKVMAGDKVSATVLYYHAGSAGGHNTNFATTVLGSLGQAISGSNAATQLVEQNATAITTQLNGVGDFLTAVHPNGNNPSSTTPQAFLTVLFFDERFNFISAADGGVAQQQVAASVGSTGSSLTIAAIKAPKNGYAFVYVSNQSNNDVYFDNLLVSKEAGRIIEENHYYSYGLKIAGISSRKLGSSNVGELKNGYLYNGKELFEDADLNWYDYGFRFYDPQIGRFPQHDPLTDEYPALTPYQYASCDPITNIDVDGLEGASSIGGFVGGIATDVPTGLLAVEKSIKGVVVVAGRSAAAAAKGNSLLTTTAKVFIKVASVYTNVSESTCLGCGSNKNAASYPSLPERSFAFSTNTKATSAAQIVEDAAFEKLSGFDKWKRNYEERDKAWNASVGKTIREEIKDGIENSPTNFLFIGNFKKAGKYELMGWHDEAGGAFKDGVVELAVGWGVNKVVGYGVKYVFAAKTSTSLTYLTKAGKYPSWSTVKSRYWNLMNGGKVRTGTAQVRMRATGEIKTINVSKELHHINGRTGADPHRFSNLKEVWPWEHQAIDPSRHIGYDFIQWVK